MKDKILQLAVECGFDMGRFERMKALYREVRELEEEIYNYTKMYFGEKNSNYSFKNLKHEIADVYITSILLCSALGIDFDTIVADKIEEVRKRYGRKYGCSSNLDRSYCNEASEGVLCKDCGMWDFVRVNT